MDPSAMTAPQTASVADRTPLPRVRLDVRTGSGRSVTYEVATHEFLIGGATGCDLRLPNPDLPPVVCQLSRKAESVTVRLVAAGCPVQLNGRPLPPNTPVPLQPDDRLALAGVEIVVNLPQSQYVSPRFVPLDPGVAKPDRELELDRRERELEAKIADLEADRVAWYRRRQEFEAEMGRAAVDVAERERLVAWERDLTAREERLANGEADLQAGRAEYDCKRNQLADDLLRADRIREELDARERKLDARTVDLDARLDQLTLEAGEWEATVRLAAAEQDRLRAEAERQDRQRLELDSQSAKLAERSAQLESQQNVLAVLRAKLDRTREEVEREAAALAAARVREEESQAELRNRIRDAEQLRAELSTVQANAVMDRQRLDERDSLLSAGLEEIRQQRESLAATEARLREWESSLDARSAEFAEQTGSLKGHLSQAFDLQARLEADRVALREREAALAQAEDARQALQESLRKRSEELAARAKSLEEQVRSVAADRGQLDAALSHLDAARVAAEEQVSSLRAEVAARAADVERQAAQTAEREAALAVQIERLKEVGQALAAERKGMADERAKWDADRAAAAEEARRTQEELDSLRLRASTEIATLRSQAPELDEQAQAALDRLNAAKDVLRGHLAELHAFARKGREDLEAIRNQVRSESERLAEQAATLDHAREEHRLAVAEFRQQLVEWQGKVAEIKQALARGEVRLETKHAEVTETARQAEATSIHIAEQVEQLRREREEVGLRRSEMERHLADMREWYRRKLKELAAANADRGSRNAEFPTLRLAHVEEQGGAVELEPVDRQLGELLRSYDLVDGETLAALWSEAGRQRRTLRQVLLASGAITLYQLALIEAGNVDGLMLGRFRVIDRLRATPRETLYRVFDPSRADARNSGTFLLRHLSEAEMQDATHPDEFRQRFAAARAAAHSNLTGVVELLELDGRPAVLLEWLTGLYSADWPAHASHPGCWVRLMTMAAEGIAAAHRVGLVHGRLTSDSFLLPASGVLKVTGFGEPLWLSGGPLPSVEPSFATDLRSLGQVSYGWSQLALKKRTRPGKAFPAELIAIVRRLEADPEPPMADTVPADQPYQSAEELVADLKRVARETPFSDDAWEKLLRHVTENAPDSPAGLRQSA
jgi:hypothetical protein